MECSSDSVLIGISDFEKQANRSVRLCVNKKSPIVASFFPSSGIPILRRRFLCSHVLFSNLHPWYDLMAGRVCNGADYLTNFDCKTTIHSRTRHPISSTHSITDLQKNHLTGWHPRQ
jgi:hypothetical protein